MFSEVYVTWELCCSCSSSVSDSRNSSDQPDLFTPFYSYPLAAHIVFQVIKTGVEPSDRGDD